MSEIDLTLKQVRRAGVFAWHDDGIVFAYGEMYALDSTVTINSSIGWSPRTRTKMHIAGFDRFEHRTIASHYGGWRHMDDCDCEFCKPLAQSDDQTPELTVGRVSPREPCVLDDQGWGP
jgi:hypothetical protein